MSKDRNPCNNNCEGCKCRHIEKIKYVYITRVVELKENQASLTVDGRVFRSNKVVAQKVIR